MSVAKSTSPFDTSMKWRQLNFIQKIAFMCKFVVMLSTFGFVFPNLLD